MVKRALDKKLCAVELHAPTQLCSDHGFSLFAVLTFDIKADRHTIEDRNFSVRYGFHAAELRLRLKRCQMAPTGRYVRLLKPRTLRIEKEHESGKSRKAAGRIGLGFAEIFGFVSPSGQISSTRHSAVKASVIESGIVEITCAVVQRHGEYWRVYGIENADGVLCGQLLGDEKLCDIECDEDCEISVDVLAEPSDLWVQVEGEEGSLLGEANRQGICSALVAKSLKLRRNRGTDIEGSPLLLATDHLAFARSGEALPAADEQAARPE